MPVHTWLPDAPRYFTPDPVRVHPVFLKRMKEAGLNTDNVVEQKPLPMWADGGAPKKDMKS